MKPIKWKKGAPRLYTHSDLESERRPFAILFGAPGVRPFCWAWKVWWRSGSMGRVQNSYREAKAEVERTIREVQSGEISV